MVNLLRLQAEELQGRHGSGSGQPVRRPGHPHCRPDRRRLDQEGVHAAAEFARLSSDPIEIVFHSPGGDVFSGFSLFDYILKLRGDGIQVTTSCYGLAASMAGLLLQAGDVRVMSPHSWMMIHEVGSGVIGKLSAVRDEQELLERIERDGLAVLAERSHLTVDEIQERSRRKDWWLTAEEALELGFIDEIRPQPAGAAAPKVGKKRARRAA